METNQNLAAAKALIESKATILVAWVEAVSKDPRLRPNLIGREEAQHYADTLLEAFNTAIARGNFTDTTTPEFTKALELLSAMSSRQEAQGFTPFETATSILCFKDACLPHLAELFRADTKLLASQTLQLNRLVDSLALSTYEALVRRREETVSRQAREILEIATPVVRLWEGVLLTPLIGTLDSTRTQRVLEALLGGIVQHGAGVAILDITGVPSIDSKTSQHLIETASAVRLLGAQIIVTGMRPGIAQTLVHLGVDLEEIITCPSLALGLRRAFDLLGIDAVRRKEGGVHV